MDRVIAVVVTYNRKDLLKECIRALLIQTHQLDKVVVVDNCSTDGTSEWLENLDAAKVKALYMDENVGGAGGFNIGMQEACKHPCEYVVVLDDDCILDEYYIEKLIEGKHRYSNKSNGLEVSALCGTVYENGRIAVNHRGYMVKHRYMHMLDYWSIFSEIEYENEYLKCDISSFCGLMISRAAIEKVGYPKANYFIKCDDTEYSLRLSNIGDIMNINGAVLNHKIKMDTSKQKFDWKYYYDIRNGIDMTNTNKLYFCSFKIIVRSLKVAISEHKIRRWMSAIEDGYKRNLGRRDYS